jgi:hypothetical protein
MIPRLKHNWLFTSFFAIAALAAAMFATTPAFAQGQSGATLQADKTLDICDNGDGTWTYSGAVAVWNTGANTALACQIFDKIESKVSGPQWTQQYVALNNVSCGNLLAQVPGGTTEASAFVTTYSVAGAPLSGTIRNNAQVTIANHSGGRTNGPNPKFTYTGSNPPPACELEGGCGCALTQGYWKNHTSDPGWTTADLSVFNTDGINGGVDESLTILNTAPQGNPWYIVAKQYIAYLLNVGKLVDMACTPTGLQPLVDGMANFFSSHKDPVACDKITGKGGNPNPCNAPLADACILDNYNHGLYVGGPTHCGGVEDNDPLICTNGVPN